MGTAPTLDQEQKLSRSSSTNQKLAIRPVFGNFDVSGRNWNVAFKPKPTLQDLYNRAPKVIEDLLKYLEPHKREDYPRTCGACGTPNANCDTDCMDAAAMSEHDGAIHRATEWIKAVKRRKQ